MSDRSPISCRSLVVSLLLLSLTACTEVEPATPVLLSVEGHGVFTPTHKPPLFTFNDPVSKTIAGSTQTIFYDTARVRFSVPYPTSIELAINGKPLTKVDRGLSTQYEYGGDIENPGGNPATWHVGVRTPFDQRRWDGSYVLTIVDVSNSKRSQPLSIEIQGPIINGRFIQVPPPPSISASVNIEPESASTPAGVNGPCPGGASEQPFHFCESCPSYKFNITLNACSYSSAASLLGSSAPGCGITQGAC